MKTTIIAAAVFVSAFVLGCNEQSPVEGSLSAPGYLARQAGESQHSMVINTTIPGPLGIHFRVIGSIPYSFKSKEGANFVETSANVSVVEVETQRSWAGIGAQRFFYNEQAEEMFSETVVLQSNGVQAHYNLVVEYNIQPNIVTIQSLKMVIAPAEPIGG